MFQSNQENCDEKFDYFKTHQFEQKSKMNHLHIYCNLFDIMTFTHHIRIKDRTLYGIFIMIPAANNPHFLPQR